MTAATQDRIEAGSIAHRIWLACVWCWPAAIVGFAVPFIFVAGFIPPPSPDWSAEELASFFADNVTGIRIGILAAMFASGLLLPFYAVISAEIKKIEGEPGLLSTIQWGGAIILVTFFQIISLAWITASYRQDVSPEITRMLNDYCWFVWSTLIPTYMTQYFVMAIAGFIDRRDEPLWPRWAAYMNLWVAVTGAGGVLAVFFKTGPFAWNGVVGFWIPVILFAVGMSVNTWLLLRHGRREFVAKGSSQGPTER
ncbi:hypothetical protein [Nocardioides sp. GCM10030258]|uniref:hypothetical protein n=1 Tax=unclassified Nocardioides TaxID=2615069 RepID=UPI003618633C